MKVQPLHNQILVELIEPDTTSAGGLDIPEYSKEKPREGTVLDIGPEVENKLKGSRVLIKKWGGTDLKIDGKDCLLIEFVDILAIVTEDSDA